MKKVLIVASDFPPMGGTNVRRVLKFIKYMPNFGWQPVILTVSERSLSMRDETNLNEIPTGTEIHRAFWPNLFSVIEKKNLPGQRYSLYFRILGHFLTLIRRYLVIPDNSITWVPFALIKGICICKREKIDLIYSTVPHYGNHLVGFLLRKITKKPWVADYRDLLTGRPFRKYPYRLKKKIEEYFDRLTLINADHIVTISEPMKEFLVHYFSIIDSEKIKVIPNGIDFQNMGNLNDKYIGVNKNKLSIVYTGNLYKGRSAVPFLEALAELINSNSHLQDKISVDLCGLFTIEENELINTIINQNNLNSIIKIHGLIDRKEALELQRSADILLLIVGDDPNSSGIFTGKIFEYLEAQKKILAISSEGVAAELIRDSNCGVVISPKDKKQIQEYLKLSVQHFFSGRFSCKPNLEYLSKFDLNKLTKELIGVFEALIR